MRSPDGRLLGLYAGQSATVHIRRTGCAAVWNVGTVDSDELAAAAGGDGGDDGGPVVVTEEGTYRKRANVAGIAIYVRGWW